MTSAAKQLEGSPFHKDSQPASSSSSPIDTESFQAMRKIDRAGSGGVLMGNPMGTRLRCFLRRRANLALGLGPLT